MKKNFTPYVFSQFIWAQKHDPRQNIELHAQEKLL
jgi:hypothetical protein